MLKKMLGVMAVVGPLMAPALAQSPDQKPGPKPQAAEQPRPEPTRAEVAAQEAPSRPSPGQAVNIRLDLTITDQTGPGEPTRKVVTMIVADGQSGFIRSKAMVRTPPPQPGQRPSFVTMAPQYRELTINVDARPFLLKRVEEGGNIRVYLGLQYQPTVPAGTSASSETEPGMLNLNEQISVILTPDKPLVVSQAADPALDRRISVELKATILK